jgi:hypothetical protein
VTNLAPRLSDLGLAGDRPLLLIDVDEVLGLFMKGFGDFVAAQGLEFRMERFALFQNIYRPGETTHLPLEQGQPLFDDFFATACHQIEPAQGAPEALARLSRHAEILILSNAPKPAEGLRRQWLAAHGMDYPLVLNSGPKGPIAQGLIAQAKGPFAFVDDLISNLDSVSDHAPHVATFQHVADTRLRSFAPASDRHPRHDDWQSLGDALEAAVRV